MTNNESPEQRSLADRALERTVAGQTAFLKAFAKVGTVTAACLTSRVGRRTVYDWIEHDERFACEFEEARRAAADVLEFECRRRAVEGVAEPRVLPRRDCRLPAALLRHLPARSPERVPTRAVQAPP
jgi:hypothetical protein